MKDQIIATNEASTIKCSLLSEGISGRERAKSIYSKKIIKLHSHLRQGMNMKKI